MIAIFKREMRGYFTGVIGYVFLVLFLAVAGVIFAYTTMFAMSSDVSSYFTIMLLFSAIILPVLTMKSFSEERKMKTEQLLLTAPVYIPSMVIGKFLASYTVFAGATALTSLYFLFLIPYAKLKFAVLFGNLIAMLLVGMSFVAVGIFISSLTENIVAAAVGTMGTLLLMAFASVLNSRIDVYVIRQILSWVSVYSRYQYFTYGLFDVSATLYYLSITVVFLFLTVRVQDRRRWA